MKKMTTFLLLLLFIQFSAFSSLYDTNNDIKELNTKHFSIVFDIDSINEAYLIYDNCEQIYQDISDFFGLERTQKIDVVITSDYEQFNGGYYRMPYPRIVLYNTPPINNEFNYFSSNFILNTFKHELTHAVTLLGENNFIQRTFTQGFNTSAFNITKFNSEGFAVLYESQDGEGRLNSYLYKARLIDSILDDHFLKYNEVQGNRDVSPTDVYYLYGAFFNQYLIDTYGIEKFREYVNQLRKFNIFFIDANYNFSKVYNENVYDVWSSFEKSFKLPDIKQIEYETYDKFLPSQIFKMDDEVYVFQRRSDSIKNVNSNKTISRLLDNTYYVSANEDKFVLSAYKSDIQLNTNTFIIDKDNKKDEIAINNYKMPIYYNDGLVGIYNEGEQQYIAFVKNEEIFKKININKNEYIQKIDSINNKIVYWSKYEKKDKINIILDNESIKSYDIDNTQIVDFSISGNKIILSVIKDNQLPRLAYIDLDTDKLFINSFDIKGGVLNPILINNELYYISGFFDYKELRKADINQFDLVENQINIQIKNQAQLNIKTHDLNNAKNYNSLSHVFKGSFFPYPMPINDLYHYSGNLYFESVDPGEYISTQILYSQMLYSNYNFGLVLSLSNSSITEYKSLNLVYESPYDDLSDSASSLILNYRKIFDLKNNTSFQYGTRLGLLDLEVGFLTNSFIYQIQSSVGPTIDNVFKFNIEEQFNVEYNINLGNFNYYNIIGFSLRFPSLIPTVKFSNSTFNLPFKMTLEFYNDSYNIVDYRTTFSLLLFNVNVQKSFKRIPIYFNNFQTYLNYRSTSGSNIIELFTLFTSSITQTSMNLQQFCPGFKYSYDLDDNDIRYEIGLYSTF